MLGEMGICGVWKESDKQAHGIDMVLCPLGCLSSHETCAIYEDQVIKTLKHLRLARSALI